MFLFDLVTIKVLTTKVLATRMRLMRLAKFCGKNYIENQEKRTKIKSIWEKEQAYLIAKYSKKDTDEARDKEHKLIYFDADIKQDLIVDYLDRCKLRHSNLYYQWRCHFVDKLDKLKG